MNVGRFVSLFVCAFNFRLPIPFPLTFFEWNYGKRPTHTYKFPVGVRFRFTNYLLRHTYAISWPLYVHLLIFIVVNSTFNLKWKKPDTAAKSDFFLVHRSSAQAKTAADGVGRCDFVFCVSVGGFLVCRFEANASMLAYKSIHVFKLIAKVCLRLI